MRGTRRSSPSWWTSWRPACASTGPRTAGGDRRTSHPRHGHARAGSGARTTQKVATKPLRRRGGRRGGGRGGIACSRPSSDRRTVRAHRLRAGRSPVKLDTGVSVTGRPRSTYRNRGQRPRQHELPRQSPSGRSTSGDRSLLPGGRSVGRWPSDEGPAAPGGRQSRRRRRRFGPPDSRAFRRASISASIRSRTRSS
jgi:hypothetical protein